MSTFIEKSFRWFRKLGPGLLYAGAAVGVSHLVQSTKAGAEFGWELLWVVVVANILRYPFFAFGPRYAAATGTSLLEGYKKLGNWALWLSMLLTLGSMFIIQAAVTLVTAGLAIKITGVDIVSWQWCGILLLICAAVLFTGRYSILDKIVKVVILVLTVTTCMALCSALFNPLEGNKAFEVSFDWGNKVHIALLIGLVGWMPAPLDVSVWHSLWTVARNKNRKASLKGAMLDFNVGYWGTMVLAIGFLALGAVFMYGSGEKFSPKAAVFAGQLIHLYTSSIGSWAYAIIAIAAFTTMFSTTLTCLDAFPRVMQETTRLLFASAKTTRESGQVDSAVHLFQYRVWLVVTIAGAMIILVVFLQNMGQMVALATMLAFVSAPVIALLNYLVITHKDTPDEAKISSGFKVFSWIGMLFLSLFSIVYIVWIIRG